jgi:hypothetical protein
MGHVSSPAIISTSGADYRAMKQQVNGVNDLVQ